MAEQMVTIKATLHGAARIPKMDYFGHADPYVRMVCLGQSTRCTKRVDTATPVWEETLSLTVPHAPEGGISVGLQLWDEDLGPDDLIGVLWLDVAELLEAPKSGTFELDLAEGVEPHEGGLPQITLHVSAVLVDTAATSETE